MIVDSELRLVEEVERLLARMRDDDETDTADAQAVAQRQHEELLEQVGVSTGTGTSGVGG